MVSIAQDKRSLERVLEEMERAKQCMASMIVRKAGLCDPEVVEASTKLDNLLNEYYRLLGPQPGARASR